MEGNDDGQNNSYENSGSIECDDVIDVTEGDPQEMLKKCRIILTLGQMVTIYIYFMFIYFKSNIMPSIQVGMDQKQASADVRHRWVGYRRPVRYFE